jgi:ribosomal protein L37AE/L43A
MRPPSDHPLPPLEPLAVAPYPAAGEHFGSYVRRLAKANEMDSLYALISHLGLLTLSPTSAERTWSRLAEATGFEPGRLDALRMSHAGDGRNKLARIDDADFQYGFLDRVHLRSCAACLTEDGHLPNRFSIRQITACARHGLQLDDECVCGRARRIVEKTTVWACPACGAHPADARRKPATDAEMLVARLLSPDPNETAGDLPAALLAEPLSARAAVIERLGRLSVLERHDGPSTSHHNVGAKTPDRTDKGRRIRDDREVVTAAADLLMDWPNAYHDVLARLLDRHQDPKAVNALLRRFSSQAGHVALRSFVDHDRRIIRFAEDARLAALNTIVGYVPDKELVQRTSGHYERMPCEPSATVSEPRVDANFVSAFEFGTRLHVGDRLWIQSWFEAGFIGTVRHADGAVLVRRADFDALLIRVRDLPDGRGDDRDYASSVELNNRRGAIYRQRYMLEDVLSGAIRSRPAGNDAEGMRAKLLHRPDFERQRMLCKTAIQMIDDEFVRVPSYLPALWNRRIPTENAIAKLRDDGRLRTITESWGARLSVRDLVRIVQDDGDQRMFVTDPVELADIEHADWRTILADGLCAKSRR